MRFTHFALGAALLLAAAAFSASGPATAAPGGALGALKAQTAEQSMVEKTHGWHRSCRRGLNGWHRHIPGVGRQQCSSRRCWTNRWGVRRCTWF